MKTTLLVTTALVLATASAHAQSIPPEGPIAVTFTATQIPAPKPMPISGGREFVAINQVMTATNDVSGNPILHNMAGRCQLTRLSDPTAGNVRISGYCTYQDFTGDQIFEECDFIAGTPNGCKLTGGTGKFTGLQAVLTITGTPLKANFEGINQLIGHKTGNYKIVR
jgi:hypothetical protein